MENVAEKVMCKKKKGSEDKMLVFPIFPVCQGEIALCPRLGTFVAFPFVTEQASKQLSFSRTL